LKNKAVGSRGWEKTGKKGLCNGAKNAEERVPVVTKLGMKIKPEVGILRDTSL